MNKREFVKTSSAAVLSLLATGTSDVENISGSAKNLKKHWLWVNPNDKETANDLEIQYRKFYEAGIRGIFFEGDSEKHFRAAKKNKIEAHRWMWTLNRGEKDLLSTHPEWYAISRSGQSCAETPPYVNYYRWLCPSRPEVTEYLEEKVKGILKLDYVDGIHLDYVRFCDVILPVNLWDKYKIEQISELPEYDFCYCKVCRSKFKAEKSIDPLEIKYPDQSLSWRKFRYDAVTSLVNKLADVVASYKKPITAAVFPTPEVAKRIVRQDWVNWNLGGVCPMIYHGFYKEDVSWIGDAVEEGVKALNGKFPLYAGLFIPDFKDFNELKLGIELSMANGASGVSLFGKVDDGILKILTEL